jgi:uncharacterized protein
MAANKRPFAVITGASTGIGYEFAKHCASQGFDLAIAANDEEIFEAAAALGGNCISVDVIKTDLATLEGVRQFYDVADGRRVDVLFANAGHGLGGAFLDQDLTDIRHVVDTNITGTIYLVQLIGRDMRARGEGRILLNGSIAGFMPGTYAAVYNGTKAFINSFSFAIRAELEGTGVTVTCLMPGATDTAFFERAGMEDTRFARDDKDDPADVARAGFDAMIRGDGDVVAGWKNKIQAAVANVTPAERLAVQHRKMAEPRSGEA